MTERWQDAGFGLYVHWPYCLAKCPYCDFNSHVAREVDTEAWTNAFLAELDRSAAETTNRRLASIFFGGGTPSLMPPSMVEAIIDRASTLWTPANDLEVTLEANPTSVEAAKFRSFRAAGVNRVSIGIQALNDSDLRRLGRMHSKEEAIQAISTSQDVFQRTSFDLIYARQDQTLVEWETELRFAISLAAEHLSLYQLTIEPDTVFGERFERGLLKGLPGEDASADMFLLTQQVCESLGLPAYEVSNHARRGHEARHNIIYWRGGDYVGIGPGSHGRLTRADGRRVATIGEKVPLLWLQKVQTEQNGEVARDSLSLRDQAAEFLVMGLRLAEGIDGKRFSQLFGQPLPSAELSELSSLGMIEIHNDRIVATTSGKLILNAVIEKLMPDWTVPPISARNRAV